MWERVLCSGNNVEIYAHVSRMNNTRYRIYGFVSTSCAWWICYEVIYAGGQENYFEFTRTPT